MHDVREPQPARDAPLALPPRNVRLEDRRDVLKLGDGGCLLVLIAVRTGRRLELRARKHGDDLRCERRQPRVGIERREVELERTVGVDPELRVERGAFR